MRDQIKVIHRLGAVVRAPKRERRIVIGDAVVAKVEGDDRSRVLEVDQIVFIEEHCGVVHNVTAP
jgi:hypothetical protein